MPTKVREAIRIIEEDGWYPVKSKGSHWQFKHPFLVIIEGAGQNFSAYSPDLPGCVAMGANHEETEANMSEAIRLHIEGLKEDGLPIPASTSTAEYVVVNE